MFRRLHNPVESLSLTIDGAVVMVEEGDTVAAALMLSNSTILRRTNRTGAERGIYCGMGVCFDCLVTINGEANRQACLVLAQEGMRVETGCAAPNLTEEKSE